MWGKYRDIKHAKLVSTLKFFFLGRGQGFSSLVNFAMLCSVLEEQMKAKVAYLNCTPEFGAHDIKTPLSFLKHLCLLLPSNTMYIILIYCINAYSRCHPYLWCHVQLCENVTSALPLVFLHTFCLAKRALFVKSGAFVVVKSLFINVRKTFHFESLNTTTMWSVSMFHWHAFLGSFIHAFF